MVHDLFDMTVFPSRLLQTAPSVKPASLPSFPTVLSKLPKVSVKFFQSVSFQTSMPWRYSTHCPQNVCSRVDCHYFVFLSLSEKAFHCPWKDAIIFRIPMHGDLSKPQTVVLSPTERFWNCYPRFLNLKVCLMTANLSSACLVLLVIWWLISRTWLISLDNHGEAHLFSLNTSVAFDRVWHEGLLLKL